MSPIAHFIGSWLVSAVTGDNPRDRRLITLAGVLPDVDGAGMVVDVVKHLTTGAELNFAYYQKYHHIWLHGWPGAVLIAAVLAALAHQPRRVVWACLITFHLHLLCDLLGSRGPSPADLWPICYGEPLLRHPVWFWKHQWRLDGWQNTVVFLAMFGSAMWITVKRGYSFAELLGRRADAAFTGVVQKWWATARRQHPS